MTIIVDKMQYGKNFINITSYLGKKPAIALKHNAYGVGLLEVAKALDKGGCETYFVNYLKEAITLKKNLKNVITIITLEYTKKKDLSIYLKYNIVLTIASMEELNHLLPLLTKYHLINLYFDTGLSGKGFLWTEAEEVFEKTKSLNIFVVISHLSSAWKEHGLTNRMQLTRFQQVKKVFNKLTKKPLYSLSNTDGSRLGPEFTLDMVRHGRGIHGISYYGNIFGIQPAFKLVGKVQQVKNKLEKGSKSGYGALVDIIEGHNIGIVDVGAFYVNRINFKFTNQVKWQNKSGEYRYFNVLTVALGYSIVDFEDCYPQYFDQVEFVFVSRFDNPF